MNHSPHIPRCERWFLAIGFAILIALKIAYAFTYRIDSDEPQHLHVVWGWTQGKLPYRDFFDNHTPLFQFLCSPLLKWLGERADILVPMRLAMLPIFAASLCAVYRIGAALFSPRIGIWAALFAGLWPNFLLTMTEFRTDDLWTALWLIALAILVGVPFMRWRAFAAGLVLGTAFGVSLKTSLMVLSLVLAISTLLVIRLVAREPVAWRRLCILVGFGLAGMAIVPAAVAVFFYAVGAWRPFYACVISHNALPGLGHWHDHLFQGTLFPPSIPSVWWFPLALPLLFFGARKFVALHDDRALGLRRAALLLAAAFFYLPMRSFWPLITRQDFLPLDPLWGIAIAAAIIAFVEMCCARGCARPAFCLAALTSVACLEASEAFEIQLPWHNKASEFQQRLGETLHLTDPGDLVMDGKGETIFRERPFYYVLEGITQERIRRGYIPDDIPEHLVATRTCVASTGRLPPRARDFVEANYLQVNRTLRVAGRYLGVAKPGRRWEFDLAIPAVYALDSHRKQIAATLDGEPYTGPRFLQAGHHECQIVSGQGPVYVVWAQALNRGFSPADVKPEAKKKHPDE